jgi:NAD(P)-dependent dehydrogenase (short-subunit alcohol dehydrogenase family)
MGKVALVFGANGVSGLALLEALFEQPKSEWSKIVSVSRRPPQLDHKDDRVHHISIDLLHKSAEDLAAEIDKAGGREVTHAFHYTYIEKSDENELTEVNQIFCSRTHWMPVRSLGPKFKSFNCRQDTR